MPVGSENLGGETHFLEGRVHEFQVGLFIILLAGLERGQNQFTDNVGPPDATDHFDDGRNGVVCRSISGREVKRHTLVLTAGGFSGGIRG